jgi:hypothetical protein
MLGEAEASLPVAASLCEAPGEYAAAYHAARRAAATGSFRMTNEFHNSLGRGHVVPGEKFRPDRQFIRREPERFARDRFRHAVQLE